MDKFIKQDDIKTLIDGKKAGQVVTFIVKARGDIIPTAVCNAYINLNAEFLQILPSVEMPTSNMFLSAGQAQQPIPINNFLFATTIESYTKIFGPYKPNKVIEFNVSTSKEV